VLPVSRRPDTQRAAQCDRFIPARSVMDMNVARFNLAAEDADNVDVKEVLSPTKARSTGTTTAALRGCSDSTHIKGACALTHALTRPFLTCALQQEAYKKRLAENLLASENAKEAKILAFKTKVSVFSGLCDERCVQTATLT